MPSPAVQRVVDELVAERFAPGRLPAARRPHPLLAEDAAVRAERQRQLCEALGRPSLAVLPGHAHDHAA